MMFCPRSGKDYYFKLVSIFSILSKKRLDEQSARNVVIGKRAGYCIGYTDMGFLRTVFYVGGIFSRKIHFLKIVQWGNRRSTRDQ